MTDAFGGFIVVVRSPGQQWTVPAQELEPDRGLAAKAMARGNRRAGLAGRTSPYMLATVTVEAQLPTAAQLRAWLGTRGWRSASPEAGQALWFPAHGAPVHVPGDDTDPALIMEAVEGMAAAEGVTPAALVQGIAAAAADGG